MTWYDRENQFGEKKGRGSFFFTARVGDIIYYIDFVGFHMTEGWVLQTKKGRNICINFVAGIKTKKKRNDIFFKRSSNTMSAKYDCCYAPIDSY